MYPSTPIAFSCRLTATPRTQKIDEAHEGAKSVKLTFLGKKEKLVSVGFTRQSQRQFKVWDPRDMSKCVKKIDIDQAAGVIIPHFDDDTNVLYLAGKVRWRPRCESHHRICREGARRRRKAVASRHGVGIRFGMGKRLWRGV